MLHGREKYLALEGGAPKFPSPHRNIEETKESHDRFNGGCEFCYAARSLQNTNRTAIRKFFFPLFGAWCNKVPPYIFLL